MTTTRDAIAAALIAHSYNGDDDYGYHCICGHATPSQAGLVEHIADMILAACTLPAFTGFQIEWQVRDTKTGHVESDSPSGAFALTSRDEAEQMIRDWPNGDLEVVCRETGTTDWHRPAKGAAA